MDLLTLDSQLFTFIQSFKLWLDLRSKKPFMWCQPRYKNDATRTENAIEALFQTLETILRDDRFNILPEYIFDL